MARNTVQCNKRGRNGTRIARALMPIAALHESKGQGRCDSYRATDERHADESLCESLSAAAMTYQSSSPFDTSFSIKSARLFACRFEGSLSSSRSAQRRWRLARRDRRTHCCTASLHQIDRACTCPARDNIDTPSASTPPRCRRLYDVISMRRLSMIESAPIMSKTPSEVLSFDSDLMRPLYTFSIHGYHGRATAERTMPG